MCHIKEDRREIIFLGQAFCVSRLLFGTVPVPGMVPIEWNKGIKPLLSLLFVKVQKDKGLFAPRSASVNDYSVCLLIYW